MAISSG